MTDHISQDHNQILELISKSGSLSELALLIQEHFEFEETQMKKIDFIFFNSHRTAHQNLLKDLKSYIERTQNGETDSDKQCRLFLNQWFLHHIQTHDSELMEALKQAL